MHKKISLFNLIKLNYMKINKKQLTKRINFSMKTSSKRNFFVLSLFAISIILSSCKKDEEVIQEDPPLPPGIIINVPEDYPTIKMAADSAGINDTIFVAAGYYYEHDIILSAGTHLISVEGFAGSVTIDADSHGRCIRLKGEKYLSSIVGFTLINGLKTAGEYPDDVGGGLYGDGNAPLYISNSKFLENEADIGGGIFWGDKTGGSDDILNESITLVNCTFESNNDINALLRNCNSTFQNCKFIDGYGGGARVSGLSTFYDCIFQDNSYGEGAYVGGYSNFEHCAWENNLKGGLYVGGYESVLKNCSFINNTSYERGGGIFSGVSSLTLLFCIFENNSVIGTPGNGGALNHSNATIENCTFNGNYAESGLGGAIYAYIYSESIIRNTIVSNCEKGTSIYIPESATTSIECTDIWGNTDGDWVGNIAGFADQNGNFSLDPLYSTDNYNISSSSPCAANNNSCNVLIGAMPVQK